MDRAEPLLFGQLVEGGGSGRPAGPADLHDLVEGADALPAAPFGVGLLDEEVAVGPGEDFALEAELPGLLAELHGDAEGLGVGVDAAEGGPAVPLHALDEQGPQLRLGPVRVVGDPVQVRRGGAAVDPEVVARAPGRLDLLPGQGVLLDELEQPADCGLDLGGLGLDLVGDVLVHLETHGGSFAGLGPVVELLELLAAVPEEILQAGLGADVAVALEVDLQDFEVVQLDLRGLEELPRDFEALDRARDEVPDIDLGLPVLLEVQQPGDQLQTLQALQLMALFAQANLQEAFALAQPHEELPDDLVGDPQLVVEELLLDAGEDADGGLLVGAQPDEQVQDHVLVHLAVDLFLVGQQDLLPGVDLPHLQELEEVGEVVLVLEADDLGQEL